MFDDVMFEDHLLSGEAALRRFLIKGKHASRIVELHRLKGQEKNLSHLVAYIDQANKARIAPRGYSMIQRHLLGNSIEAKDTVINELYAKPLGDALQNARFVNVLNLRNTNLDDDIAMTVLSKIDRTTVTHLDLSENPRLTPKFYEFLTEMISEFGTNLQMLEL